MTTEALEAPEENAGTEKNEQVQTGEGNTSYSGLWRITAGQRNRYVGAIFAMALTNLFLFGAPIIGGHAIDVISKEDFSYGDPILLYLSELLAGEVTYISYLWVAGAASLVMTIFGGVFLYARGRLAAQASENIARSLRETLYRHLHHINAKFYDTADTGDLVQRCSSDVETLRVFLVSDVIEIGRAIMLVVCVVPILFSINASLAMWSLCMMPFLAIGAFVFFQKVKDAFEQTDEAEGALTARLQENLTGIRVVRAFARQEYETERFAERNADFRNKNVRLIELMGYYWSVSDFFSMTQIGLVLFIGGWFAFQGEITIGDLFIFLTCESIVIWPVRHLGRVLTDTGKAVISLGRVNHILQECEENEEWEPATGRATGLIEAQNLCFAYNEDEAVLTDLSITIRPGETLAIVGPPGSGKTSFIRALLRLYPYHSGSLKLDGNEVVNLDRFWLRAQIGVVLQDPFLYSRTIRANLAVGRPNATAADIQRATEEAAIAESIAGFPDQFEEMVGERGVTLSGGQRQRLALARALIKDPPVLVLDDSLSAVDTGTEKLILDALKARKGKQTTLIIAHRLSSVIDADRILVLEEGRCVQLGHHSELIGVDGPYQRLCKIQGALDSQILDDLQRTRAE
ncbi:MAG: ATP-binding cassette domain-containing protein [Pseudomonadales bacterium]|nr:ATP-binding cassette domain-containing protein [Pseudomonadales bacterium]